MTHLALCTLMRVTSLLSLLVRSVTLAIRAQGLELQSRGDRADLDRDVGQDGLSRGSRGSDLAGGSVGGDVDSGSAHVLRRVWVIFIGTRPACRVEMKRLTLVATTPDPSLRTWTEGGMVVRVSRSFSWSSSCRDLL